MKRALFVFTAGIFLLLGVVSWEYIFDRQQLDSWAGHFEKRLHQKEIEADEMLLQFKDTVDINGYDWDEDLIFVGFKNKKIFFWTNEIVGMDGLYEELTTNEKFLKINNAFYEVRKKAYEDTEYFALLHIKDSYPYKNKYVKNQFGQFLGVGRENADNISVKRFAADDEPVIVNKEGEKLFYIEHNEDFKDRSVNYVFVFCYFLVFLSLFYIYDQLLSAAASLRIQLLYIVGFVLFLWGLRYVMLMNEVPASIYRLPIFDKSIVQGGLVFSIGDLMLSAFSIVQVLYITFANLKINYQSAKLKRFRYVILCGFLLFTFLYVSFLNYSIGSLIESTDVHMNIARVVNVGLTSILAFVSIIMGGLGLIIIVDGAVGIVKVLLPIRVVLYISVFILGFLALCCFVLDADMNGWGCVFVLFLYILLILNRYWVKRDVQRSVYMLIMALLSIYLVLVAKKYEQYRELTQRAGYATELIEERDYNFENKLIEISAQINDSEIIADFVANYNEEFLKMCLTDDLLDLKGYNYISEITLCRGNDSLWVEPDNVLYGCQEYFNELIGNHCIQIEHSDFYAITEFDGFVSYIGRFEFGDVVLYLRFDSTKDSEGAGYPQILSRKSIEGENIIYPYSYAKYRNGQLIYSSGDFNYYKSLDFFGKYNGNIDIIEKDDYSHMLIPVNEDSTLVMSLSDSIFSLYYVNVLYAFFICILLSSYGLFFSRNYTINFRWGTLKAKIKNSIVSLIFGLFVILTALSITLNTKSFEKRHNAKAMEFLKFINKELERLDCVEYLECPDILNVLVELSEVLKIDINIYSQQGMLVATSRPEIFSTGFNGYLVNAKALERIAGQGAMSYVNKGHIGELDYMSAYMPLVLENGKSYIINVPYFTQNDELNTDIVIMVIIAINIAIVVMVLAFILSGIVAERVTKPLQLVNDKLKQMRVGGKNEKIDYDQQDEVGRLVREYNNMVEKLEENINQLARSERESAWREMARQIAHEIKNPLTPMKLNIQFMQRSLQVEDPQEFKQRFKDISTVLIEQIDNMASIASAFSDFAKMPVSQKEVFDISEMVSNAVVLFEKNVDRLIYTIEPDIKVWADKEQVYRVVINVLKNAVQSIPEEREGKVEVSVSRVESKVIIRVKDNGCGIPAELKNKIFEPNFTTKTSGMGLGLAISRRIMESMEGTIEFKSLDVGTEFIITLEAVRIK